MVPGARDTRPQPLPGFRKCLPFFPDLWGTQGGGRKRSSEDDAVQ